MRKGLYIAIIMGILISAANFFFGVKYGQATISPEIRYIEVLQYRAVPEYIDRQIVKTVELEKIVEVPDFVAFRDFPSRDALNQWLAQNCIEEQEGRYCVDYALEMQQRAFRDGYLVSTECVGDNGGHPSHMICSTIIGDKIIFIEPTTGETWLGGWRFTDFLVEEENRLKE